MSEFSQVILVSEPSLQIATFINYLRLQLDLQIEQRRPDEEFVDLPTDQGLFFLIDIDSLERPVLEKLKANLSRLQQSFFVALINADNAITVEQIAQWPNISGIFNKSDDLTIVCRGIKRILQGEYWLPRRIMSELIAYYRSEQQTPTTKLPELTNREQEILRHLMSGASNLQIADSLYVSEHTVKSHLYNVFKKIKVKNRLQAVSWAKENQI